MDTKGNLSRLLKISSPRYFQKGEYICNEGELGNEMYIILQGKAGIYISSVTEEDALVAEAGTGDFFGEMALFEKQPRSASCIALEDTTCIAIDENNLQDFIQTCPEITQKLIAGLSRRIRQMDEKLYKVHTRNPVNAGLPFMIPAAHQDSAYEEKNNQNYVRTIRVQCPVCQNEIVTKSMRILPRTPYDILPNQRKKYRDFEPLWYYIRSCPSCGYSNDSIHFQKLPDVPFGQIKQVMETQKQGSRDFGTSPFERLVLGYFRAIHFNQCLNSEDTLLLGKLWLYLGWIYQDAGQEQMGLYCHEQALEYYVTTYTKNRFLLQHEFAQKQCAMVVGELYYERKDVKQAKEYYHAAAECSNKRLSQQAFDRIYELRDAEKRRRDRQEEQ